MRKVKKNQKRLLVISIVLFMICAMVLGYAALSSSLKIDGTGTISANWDILFTGIEEGSKKGATSNESVITDKLTATFDVNIEAPGNFIEYNVTLKNNGNIDAVIESVEGIREANREAPTGIQFGIQGLRIGDDLLAGSEKTFIVRAEIPSNETTLPRGTKTVNLKVNVRQKDIDSSGLVTTFKDCFQMNEAGDTLVKYLCGKENTTGYSEILDVTIPREIDGVMITKIGDNAFDNNMITSVNFPDTITEIGVSAFFNNRLTSIHIPNSVKIIQHNAFINNLLTEIEIPNSVTYIGVTAFRNNQMSGASAFIYNRNGDGTEDKTSLNSYAGADCGHIVLPVEIKHIGSYAFNGIKCQSIVFPEGLETIGNTAFNGTRLTTITLPNSVNYIGSYAFLHNSLTEVVLPSSLASLGVEAFRGNQLTHVVFQGTVPGSLGNDIFKNNPGLVHNTIQVSSGNLTRYKKAQGRNNSILYSPSQTWFGSDDTSLLDAFYE